MGEQLWNSGVAGKKGGSPDGVVSTCLCCRSSGRAPAAARSCFWKMGDTTVFGDLLWDPRKALRHLDIIGCGSATTDSHNNPTTHRREATALLVGGGLYGQFSRIYLYMLASIVPP
mmetsp:Transcript_44240/g.104739  ORF Transcript_44240/g.104739 Transcript_44240/m.104739 type:complete len:116 (+) Transcript_44240:681-1028(+)